LTSTVERAIALFDAGQQRSHLLVVADVCAHGPVFDAVLLAVRGEPLTDIVESCASISATTTRAPSAAYASTIARPMPAPPPVTSATRPRRLQKSACMTLRSRRSLDVREQLQAARITETMRAAVSLATLRAIVQTR
jgi:hypothetical protein